MRKMSTAQTSEKEAAGSDSERPPLRTAMARPTVNTWNP